jgi:lipopolysaccharide export system permease protein
VDKEKSGLSLLYFDSYSLDLSQYTSTKKDRWRTAGERYLTELFWPQDQNLDQNALGKLMLEGHRRLVTPLNTLVLALIALAGVLAGEFNRRGLARRIIFAAAAALAFQAGAMGLTVAADKQHFLVPLMYLYIVTGVALSVFVLYRKPKRPAASSRNAAPMETG